MSEVSCSGRLRLELVEKLTFSVVEFCSMIFDKERKMAIIEKTVLFDFERQ